MGHDNSKIIPICIALFLLLSLILSFAYPSSSDHGRFRADAHVRQTGNKHEAFRFGIKKHYSQAVFLNKGKKGGRGRGSSDTINGLKKKTRMKNREDLDARRFSAMLPKGYVPPSGSSPCHNMYPNSVAFFCHLSPDEMRQP